MPTFDHGGGWTDDCGCHQGAWWGIGPAPRCVAHGGAATSTSGTAIPSQWGVIDYGQFRAPDAPVQHTHYHLATQPRLSDEDVERIAKRVAELLRPPTP